MSEFKFNMESRSYLLISINPLGFLHMYTYEPDTTCYLQLNFLQLITLYMLSCAWYNSILETEGWGTSMSYSVSDSNSEWITIHFIRKPSSIQIFSYSCNCKHALFFEYNKLAFIKQIVLSNIVLHLFGEPNWASVTWKNGCQHLHIPIIFLQSEKRRAFLLQRILREKEDA